MVCHSKQIFNFYQKQANSLSLTTTNEVSVDFFSFYYLDVSVRRVIIIMVSLRIIVIIKSFITIFGINYLLQMYWLVIPDSPFFILVIHYISLLDTYFIYLYFFIIYVKLIFILLFIKIPLIYLNYYNIIKGYYIIQGLPRTATRPGETIWGRVQPRPWKVDKFLLLGWEGSNSHSSISKIDDLPNQSTAHYIFYIISFIKIIFIIISFYIILLCYIVFLYYICLQDLSRKS